MQQAGGGISQDGESWDFHLTRPVSNFSATP